MKTRNIREVKKKIKKVKAKTAEMYLQENMLVRLNRLEELVEDLRYDGVDDSEEVEFTKQELSTIYYAMKEVGENFPSGNENEKYLNTIISKLNKMLKEKE